MAKKSKENVGQYSLEYIDYDYDFHRRFDDERKYDVDLLRNKKPNSDRRVLFLLDHVPTEDLNTRRLLSGATGDLFFKLLDVAKKKFNATSPQDLDFLVVNYNCFKTYGKAEDYVARAEKAFKKRVEKIISEYEPDTIVCLSPRLVSQFCPERFSWGGNQAHHFFGTTMNYEQTYKKEKHKCTFVPTLSLSAFVSGKNNLSSVANILGYVARNLRTGLDGKMPYKIDYAPKYKAVNVDTLEKFDKMMIEMRKAKDVSIDTETQSLNKVVNRIQTIQFASKEDVAYVVPIYHKDTPFSQKDIKYISKRLREFFEGKNKNRYHIYTNAKFDLNVIRANFNVRYFKNDVWDIQAGEFGYDENMKILQMFITGKGGYYGLGNLALQFGCGAFLDNDFGKEQRHTIKDADLDAGLIRYCCLDVIVPLGIFRLQLQRAEDEGYTLYEKVVGNQISDQIHTFSVLESTGAKADVGYLFKLKHPSSVIHKLIEETENAIYKSDAVYKTNKLLAKNEDIPQRGLFGQVNITRFDLSKSEHKQVLFFDVLRLKPLNNSKKKRPNGEFEGKIDKDFQDKYKDHPIVDMYTKWQKACKLRNAFVNSLIKLWGESDDFKHDERIRPSYSYTKVVTGRTSASDPNLQQIPSRWKVGKEIKRIFCVNEGYIQIKVDYSAHEVRGWSIISGEQGVADVFEVGKILRDRYKLYPDPWTLHRIDFEGDVHKINAAYFFGVPIEQVSKDIRNAVKTVIFGLIYQQGLKGLAKSTGRDVKDIENIVEQFLGRFPIGVKWFGEVQDFAKENYYVESPLGRRRNLWGLICPDTVPDYDSTRAACLRRAVNSPVQGFGSDLMMIGIRNIDRMKFEYFEKTGEYPDMKLCVSVHDSVTAEVAYKWMWLALDFIGEGLTTEVVKQVVDRYDYHFTSEPEIDFEIGCNERDVEGWDFSFEHMQKIVRKTLEQQKEEFRHNIDVDKVYNQLMFQSYDTMPLYMKQQVVAKGHPVEGANDKCLDKASKKLVKQYRKEYSGRVAKWEAHQRKERMRRTIGSLRKKHELLENKVA